MQFRDDLDRTTVRLILDEPFFGHYLLGIRKEASDRFETAGLVVDDGAMCLHVNDAQWIALSDKRKQGVLKHEVLHLVFEHPFRRGDFGSSRLFDISADLVVNQYLAPGQRGSSDVQWQAFAALGWEPEQTVEYYYARLSELVDASGGAEGDDDGGAEGASEEGGRSASERHQGWEALRSMSSSEVNLLAAALDSHLRHVVDEGNHWGTLGGGLARHLRSLLDHEATLDWKRVLRLFASSAETTFLKNTLHRRSKRYGTVPGIRICRRQRVTVVLDTSASVSESDLEVFGAELRHIRRSGADVTVIECDAAVQDVYPFRGRLNEVKGGGGTSFSPAIALANERPPDAMVYLTDGFAPPLAVLPRYPVLWLLTARGAALDACEWLPGHRVKMR